MFSVFLLRGSVVVITPVVGCCCVLMVYQVLLLTLHLEQLHVLSVSVLGFRAVIPIIFILLFYR